MSADPREHYNLSAKRFSIAVLVAQCAIPLTIFIHPTLFVTAMILKSLVMVGWSIRLASTMPQEPEGSV